MKSFTVTWLDPETLIWMLLYNITTQETFQETKVWDRVCLRSIQNSKNLMKYYNAVWPDSGTLNLVFLDNIKTQKLF